jgi:hypothetical protein
VTQIDQTGQAGKNGSEYFIDIQVPISALDASAVGGPTMTANSPFMISVTTSNSNTDPTQKDLMYAGSFTLADVELPGGDVTNGNGDLVQAPIISSIVNVAACPYDTITMTILDVIDISGGNAVDTIDSVRVEYFWDVNENGLADDAGQSWERIGLATRVTGVLGEWQIIWDFTGLEDKYFVLRAVATDLDSNTTESTSQSILSPTSVTSTIYTICPPQQPPGVSDINVTVANTLVSATSQYNIQLTTYVQLDKGADDIIFTFPAGTDISALTKQDITVNGIGASDATINGQTLTIRVGSSTDIPAGTVTVVLRDPPGLVNPGTASSYTIDGSTSQEPQVNTSNTYDITSTATLTSATVNPSSSVTGRQSGYRLDFKLGGSGALTGGGDSFTIIFPNDTIVPEGQIYGVTVNGTPAAAIGTSGTRTIQVETPISLANEANVTINFALSSGLINPTTATSYTLTVATTVETSPVTSNAYAFFDGTSLSPATVVPDPNNVNAEAEYTITAQLGSNGGLTGGLDQIFLDFPATTIVPGTIALSDILVDNGTYAAPVTAVTMTPGSEQVLLTPSNDIPDGGIVTIIFKTDAGLTNPILATNYTLDMATTQEDTVTSNLYLITNATSQITQPVVVLSNSTKNQLSTYTIDFNVGEFGRMLAGTSTITIVLPSGTDVPGSIASSNVTVNGVASGGVVSDAGTRTVTVTVPSGTDIGNNGAITVVIGSSSSVITNPNANDTFTLQGNTSVEPTQVASFGYAVGSGGSGLTYDSVVLGTSTVNTVSLYTILFTPSNAVESGDNIILSLPNNTTIPASMATTDVKVTPFGGSATDATSVTTTPSIHQVNIVSPASLSNNKQHKIELLTGAGVKNPSVAKNYTKTLRTSDEPSDVISPSYSVTASTTAITIDSVSVAPTRAAESGNYIIDFTVGSSGGLLAGNNTIIVTFPAGTTVPATIVASTVSVNGSAASIVTTNPGARTVTITTPVTIANSASVNLNFAVSAGIENPSAATYTLDLRTSAETTDDASPNYTITSNTELAVTAVTPSPSAINANAGYTVNFQLGSSGGLAIGDQIIIDFPDLTGVPAIMATGDVRVNGLIPTIAPFTDGVAKKVTLTTPVSIAGNGAVTISFTNAAGLNNPGAAGSYTLDVATNIQPTFRTSPTYEITAATTTVSNANVTPSIGAIDQLATYNIDFNVGAQGALIAGTSTITIVFNDSTTLAAINAANVTVNGVQSQSVNKVGQTVTITVPNGVDIGNTDDVSVVIGSSTAVITNPGTAQDYTLTVNTSVEPTAITSFPYPIGGATTTVTPAIVTPDPNLVDNAAEYTVQFDVGGSGALTSGSSTISIIFPDNTIVPFSMAAGDVTVNGTPLSVTPSTSPTARTITMTTPENVANDGSVSVVFAIAAGLQNPSTGGTYTGQVNTSVEPTKVTSQGYSIQAPVTTVDPANVTPTPNGVNTEAEYEVGFRVGSSGALQGGSSTITLAFPVGTVIPTSIAPSKILINGTASSGVSVSGQEITITVPGSVTIGNSDSVAIVISDQALLRNPPVQGQYTLTVATSAEPTAVVSNPYTIGAATTTVSQATVTPVPATTGLTADYTVDFSVGSSGALQGGSSTITFTFNDSTGVATQTISGATINGVSAQGVADAATRTVVFTVPASVNVGNSGSVSAFIPSGVLTNPGTESSYTIDVKTSVEATDVTSYTYLITAATTTVTAATVTPSPATANSAAQYTFAFDVGAEGALTAGASTITVTLADNTTIPGTMTPGDVSVNGTPVIAAVVINQSLGTIVLTTPVSVANSGSVSLVFAVAAGLANPSAATYTAKARTSVEATNVTTNSYAITPASSTVTAASVSVAPNVVEQNGAYTVSFSVGAQGRLLAETSTITITFGPETTVPVSITPSTVTVNGVQATTVNVVGQAIEITVPAGVLINNNSAASIVFGTGADLYNPTTVASYTVTVATSTETTGIVSNTYAINPSATSTTAATVIPSPGTQSLAAKYTFSFNTGGVGALQSGVSTITMTLPAGTTVPASILTSNVTVDGFNPPAVSTTPASRLIAVTVPASASIGSSDNVIVVIGTGSDVITNPTAASYTAHVRTSVEQTDVVTNSYTISSVTTTVDSAFVGPTLGGASPLGGPSPQTANTVAQYNVKFKLGSQGALTAGSSQIVLTFPSNTQVPTSVLSSLITVNGTTVTAAPIANASLRSITMTVPSGTPSIANGDTVEVIIASSALLRNPSIAGTYRIDVRTSVEATDIPSKLYTITGATTSVTAATVTPTPDEFGLNARYRLDFSVGAQGALTGGSSTISVTFPSNTLIPDNITASTVTVNGIAATIVSADSVNRLTTITVPVGASIPNNGSVVLIYSTDALLENPDPGSTTLDVRTSVEGTDVQSSSYTIRSVAVLQERDKISLHPAWSPSDKRFAYITESPDDASGEDTGNWNLYTVNKNGSSKKQITSAISGGTIEDGDPIHYSSLTWNSDGDSLVYIGYERVIIPPDTILTLQVFQVHKEGGAFKKISPLGALEDTTQQFGGWLDPDWKLTMLAFETAQFPSGVDRIAASIDGNIWVFEPYNTDDGPGGTFKNLVQVTDLPVATGKTDGLFQPKWSPDGTKLSVVYKDSVTAKQSDIYVISDVDSILQKTLESADFSTSNFVYDVELGANAVNDLGDMTRITPISNTFPAWTPSWSTDGTQVAYSHDQANAFSLDTFSTSPKNSVVSTNFYVKLRNADGTGPDSTIIGVADANNAFPTMSNNGQRLGYFQAATTGSFLQKQKVFYLQTSGKFSPPATPKVLTRQNVVIWKLADYAYSSMEFPVTAVLRPTTFYIQEPQTVISEALEEGGRFSGVARTFGPEHVSFLEPAVITIHYTDGELLEAGLVDDSGQEERLGMFVWNTIEARWQPVANSTVDVKRNLVSAPVTKLGTFGVFYQNPGAGQLFSQVMVYPNPFRPNSGSTNDGDYSTGVIFDLVPTGVTRLDIFNIAGEWVASLGSSAFEVISPTQIRWRVTNDSSRRVASGVYIYILEAVNTQGVTERKIGKIGVIR